MKSFKSALSIIVAILFGFVLGTSLSRPRSVKAGSEWIHVQKVKEGQTLSDPLAGSEYIGFACDQDDCYVASR